MTFETFHAVLRIEDWFTRAVAKGTISDPETVGDGKRLIAVGVALSEETKNRNEAAANLMRATKDFHNISVYLARIGIDVICHSRSGKPYVRRKAICVADGPPSAA
jgi:hypothetical protein